MVGNIYFRSLRVYLFADDIGSLSGYTRWAEINDVLFVLVCFYAPEQWHRELRQSLG